ASVDPVPDSVPSDNARRARRSTRDWLVDFTLFLLAFGVGLLGAASPPGEPVDPQPTWFSIMDQLVGLSGCIALWWRRRWPLQLALSLVPLSSLFVTSIGSMLIPLFSLAVHLPPRQTFSVLCT